ncbi:MAG TPA: stage II sporulation protein M [Clostridia bacterium]
MNENSFINAHRETWQELEDILKHRNYKKGNIVQQDRLHRLLFLYQTVSGHLSVARTRYGDTNTVEYLNGLVARTHQVIFVSRTKSLSKIIRFFTHGFPEQLKKESLLFFVSAGIFILSFLFSFIVTIYRDDYALSFIPAEYMRAFDENTIGSNVDFNYSIASVVIFTNNIQVGILAFALGITFGIGTVYVLVQNGFMLGALSAAAVNRGIGYVFWSLILPHGVPELFCVFVCGAAGLLIARSIIFPGLHSRRRSFSTGGKNALFLLIGTIPLFVLAGITEGYFTPLPIDPLWKYAVSLLWLAALFIYLFAGRKKIREK